MRFILLAVLVCGCGTVTAKDPDCGTGGAGGLSSTSTGGTSSGGASAGAGGATSTGGQGGTAGTWPICPHPISAANDQETPNCFDDCMTSLQDDAGLYIRDNFGMCVGTMNGQTVYCRQNVNALEPKETPDAAACP